MSLIIRSCSNVKFWVKESHRQFSLSVSVSSAGKSRFVDTNARVSLSFAEYQTSGGPPAPLSPVLMTHGLLGSKQNWNSIAKAISKLTHRKVVTFESRNHGDSPHSDVMNYEIMAEDVLGLADQLGMDKFVFLGHSMGGRTAATLALKHDTRLSGVVVVDISPLNIGGDFDEMKSYLEAMKSITFDPSITLSEARKQADLKLTPVVQLPAIRAFILTNLAKGPGPGDEITWKPNLPVLLKNLHELKRFPAHLLNSSSFVSSLFIRGGKSNYVPDGDFAGIRKLFPAVEFSTIPNAGHWAHADSPGVFIQILVTFLRKIT